MSTKRKYFISVNRYEPPRHLQLNKLQPKDIPTHTPIEIQMIPGLHTSEHEHCSLESELRRKYSLELMEPSIGRSQNYELDIFRMFRKQLFIIMLNGEENRSIGFEYLPHLDCDQLSTDYYGDSIDCVGRALNELFMDRDYARYYSKKLKE